MRIVGQALEPVTELPYRQARRGGGTEHVRLAVGRLAVDAVPDGCDGVLVTSDLQGVAPSPFGGPGVLLGVALADYLKIWADQGLIPPPDRLVVVLAGDLYSAPTADLRGATGEVTAVWRALAAAGCRVVAGVAGNHDLITESDLSEIGNTALLDGTSLTVGGLRFAGVGLIIGDGLRPGRRRSMDQFAHLAKALDTNPDVLVLHEGPPGDDESQRGNPLIGARIRERPPPLTICGHVHWENPLANGVLNVDSRAVLLTPVHSPLRL